MRHWRGSHDRRPTSRLQLYEVARERFGAEAADTLMEFLPPMDANELATKQDLVLLRADVRQEIAELRADVRQEIAELRGEFAELREEFAAFRGEMREEFAEFRGDMRTEMHDLFREQTNRLVMFTVPTVLSGIALAFAAARF
jgi:hypothetical protein